MRSFDPWCHFQLSLLLFTIVVAAAAVTADDDDANDDDAAAIVSFVAPMKDFPILPPASSTPSAASRDPIADYPSNAPP